MYLFNLLYQQKKRQHKAFVKFIIHIYIMQSVMHQASVQYEYWTPTTTCITHRLRCKFSPIVPSNKLTGVIPRMPTVMADCEAVELVLKNSLAKDDIMKMATLFFGNGSIFAPGN